MINLQFNIRNPRSRRFENIWNQTFKTPFDHKYIELQCYKDSTWVDLQFKLTACQSHAGLCITLGLFGYCFDFNFYDSRHWNYTNNTWEVYDEKRS